MTQKSSSLRTDISRVRHLGSAHSGTQAAWRMRVTSAALVFLTVGFVWLMIAQIGLSYGEMRALFGLRILPGAVALLFVLVGCYHMRIGMRTIIEDYVHGAHLKEWSLIANTLFCGFVAAVTALAIVRISIIG